jgi:hypothetical protein
MLNRRYDTADRCSLGIGKAAVTRGSTWWPAAHDRCSRRHGRYLLFVAHGLPMAPAATPVPTLGHRLPLLPVLGGGLNLDSIAPCHL